jgi:flagellar hook-associated protein FlgK
LVQGGTVIIDSVMRSYSALLSMQYLANHGKVEQASTLNNAAEVVDKMLVDESTGLTDVFNGFFTSASDCLPSGIRNRKSGLFYNLERVD